MGTRELVSLRRVKEKLTHMYILPGGEGVFTFIRLSKEPCYPQDTDGNCYSLKTYCVKSLYSYIIIATAIIFYVGERHYY